MDTVKVRKADLLEVLSTNREAHQGIFDEAVEGYKTTAEKALQRHLRDVRTGKMKVIQIVLPAPVNHIKDYDRIIKMVEMSVDDELDLAHHEFQQYVMGDWAWKQQFLTSNSGYSESATMALNS